MQHMSQLRDCLAATSSLALEVYRFTHLVVTTGFLYVM